MRLLSLLGLLMVWSTHTVRAQDRSAAIDSCTVRALRHMGGFHADSAMFWIGRGLALARLGSDPIAEYHLLAARAEVLYYEGLFTPAWKDLDRCMVLATGLHDSLLVANVHNLRGLLHENIAADRTAITHFERSLAHYPASGTARWPVTRPYHIHGNMAHAHLDAGRIDSAERHALRSYELAAGEQDQRAMALAGTILGRVALQRNEPQEALRHFDRARQVAMDAGEQDVVLDVGPFEAEAWAAIHRPDAARRAVHRALRHAEEHRSAIGLSVVRDLHKRSAALFERLGDTAAAFHAQRSWHEVESTITAGNLRSALATQAELMRTDAELELAEERHAQVVADRERERLLKFAWTTAAVILLLAVVVIYFIDKQKRRERERTAALEMEGLRREALITELRVREQVGRDMHDDMGAGLSALKLRSEMALRVEQDPQARAHLSGLANTAGELIGSMRQIIWAMNADQAGLDDLVVYTTNHVRVQCEQYGLRVEVEVPSTWPSVQLTSQQRRNVFLVVKEALHNVVKHAAAGGVVLRMHWDEGLRGVLLDDGKGLPPGAASGMGNGLRNMRRRISELGGELLVEVRPEGGTAVAFRVPFQAGTVNEGSIVRQPQAWEIRRS